MVAVFKREFKSYFYSSAGSVLVAVCLLFFGIFSFNYNFFNKSPYIGYALADMMAIVALLLPIVSVKSLCGEYKRGTYRLLCSLPLRSGDILMGKYFAMLSLVALPVGVMALFPIVLNFFGKVNFAASYGTLLAFFAFCAAVVAVDIFISSMTESPVACAVATYTVWIVLYAANIFSALIPSEDIDIGGAVESFSLFGAFNSFVNSVFDVKCIIYYVLVAVIFLVLSFCSLEKRRLS